MTFCSLVVPCYNESKNIPFVLDNAKEALISRDIELILVDNGSTDETQKVLADLLPSYSFARSVQVTENQGYGHGILAGLRAAKGTVLAWTHADMQTKPADVVKGLEYFDGNRDPDRLFVKGLRQERPLGDRVFTAGMGIFESLLLRSRLRDINAQPTMLGRGFFDKWQDPPKDFSLDLYAFVMARKNGLEVKRFPVVFAERAHGVSHWNIDWRSRVKFIRRTLAYSFGLLRTLK